MSYAIKIISDADGVRIDTTSGMTYGTPPHGSLTIQGHEVSPGERGYRNLSLTLTPDAEGSLARALTASAGLADDRTSEPAPDTQPGGIDLREHAPEPTGDPVPSSS